MFVEGQKQALKARGVKVSVKQLLKYFEYVKDVCPWFPQEGTIDEKRWKRVGDALKDYYQTFGPEKVPITAFSYWNLIDEILSQKQRDPVIAGAIEAGEELLRQEGKRDRVSPKLKNSKPKEEEDLMSFDSKDEGPHPKKEKDSHKKPQEPMPPLGGESPSLTERPEKPPSHNLRSLSPSSSKWSLEAPPKEKKLYPSLKQVLQVSDGLGDNDWADLKEEATKYHNPDWPTLTQHPPPYAPVPSAPALACPAIDPQKLLREKIQFLKEQIKLEKEHQELIQQLEELKTGKTEESNNIEPKTKPKPPVRGATPKIQPKPEASIEHGDLEAFPVTETTDAQGQVWRHHNGFDFKVIKEIKTAVAQYGATAPYTMAIVESVAENWLTPGDWRSLARATLWGGDYLLWKSEYVENCRDTARRNAQAGNNWTYDMLAGEGNYTTSDQQMQFDAGLFAQIQVAASKAWRKIPSKGDVSASLTGIKQGPDEPFADFVHRLITAAGRIFGSAEAGTDFVKQLAFENANAACQAAIRPYKKKTDLSGYIRLCSDIGAAYQQGLAMAAAMEGYTVRQFLSHQNKNKCFSCGEIGHFAKDCKAGKTATTSKSPAPGLCPRCKRGKHWANECKSKRDAQGQPLPLPQSQSQGNGNGGQPQAPKHKQIYGAVSFVPATYNPFQASSGQQQEVPDWTSVPPPTQS